MRLYDRVTERFDEFALDVMTRDRFLRAISDALDEILAPEPVRASPQTGATPVLRLITGGSARDDGETPPAPLKTGSSDGLVGFVGVFLDHTDGTLFFSDIFNTVEEARSICTELKTHKLLGLAEVVIVEQT